MAINVAVSENTVNGCASDSLRSLLSVLPSQASLGQKGVWITFVFRPKVGDLKSDNTKAATIIENQNFTSSAGISTFQLLLYMPFLVPLLDIIPLVIHLLSAGHRDLHLGQPLLVDVNSQRHESQALLGRVADELPNLLPVQQQRPRSQRIHVETVALCVRADVHPVDEQLVALDFGKAFL